MLAILIVAHTPLATALAAAAAHAFPECRDCVSAVDVAPDEPDVEARLRAAFTRLADREVLVMTDVFGAWPCKHVQIAAAEHPRARIVTGVNVPMIWRTLGNTDFPLDELANRAVVGATQGVMRVSPAPRQNQPSPPLHHDQDDHHDQQ